MFSTLNLHLDKVEVRNVPGVQAPFRREMLWGFAENEFSALLDKIRANRVGDAELTEFCDKFGKLSLMSEKQAVGVDSPNTVMILHFREDTKETLTHYYSVLGTIGYHDDKHPLPDDAVFTPFYYWDYVVMNGERCILGNAIEFYHDMIRGYETPKTVITPSQLLSRHIVADMANAEYFGAQFSGEMCALNSMQLSLHMHNSPSTYLRNVVEAAMNAREYIKTHCYDRDLAHLGIHDCAQYLAGKEACLFSSPALYLFNNIDIEPLTLGQLRQWFSVFDKVTNPVFTPDVLETPYTAHTGECDVKETLLQELTLNAMVEMEKAGLRELRAYSDETGQRWIPSDVHAITPFLKNPQEIAQKVCDRLCKQFFTKYAELMYNVYPTFDVVFDAAGISSVTMSFGPERSHMPPVRYLYPTYVISAWSPMVMTQDRARSFSQQVYRYVQEMISE